VPRLSVVSLAVVLAALAAAPGALAKGDVTATIERPTACDAAPGTSVTIAFALTTATDHGTEPFGAGGVFVRLRRADGRSPLIRRARSDRRGHYTARVRVPRGGIRRIDVGLKGEVRAGGRVRPANHLFTVVGDPCR
jgi:hypothetical protein